MKNDPPCEEYLANRERFPNTHPGCHCHGKTFCPDKTYVMGEDEVPIAYWTEDVERMFPDPPNYQIQTVQNMTGPKPKTVPTKGVSLSGKTRLTYREACALLDFAIAGESDAIGDSTSMSGAAVNAGIRAVEKLKAAIGKAGGYNEQGNLLDPFQR